MAKTHISALITVLLLLCSISFAEAQTRAEAVDAFNEALELVQAENYAEALEKFQETRSIAQNVGSEGEDILERAEGQIPRTQLRIAMAAYQSRDFDRAVEEFDKTADLAEEFGDSEISNRVRSNVLVVLLQAGNSELNNENLDAAEGYYNQALERNENYPNPYYQLGLVERRRGNLDEALDYFDRAIQVGRAAGREEVAQNAEQSARNFLFERGAQMIEDERHRQAIGLLERALEYDMNHADSYFRLAQAHNNLGNYDEAIEHAERALELEDGGNVDRAKSFFELGIAYMNQENTQQACTAFRNASYGSFRSNAEYHLEHDLECN
ncbi:MAG: tetratricopeptide repeat protein [Cyclonatronaceae bacterium]